MAESSDRQTKLLLGLIIFAGFVLGYIYYSQFTVGEIISASPIVAERDNLLQFKNIKLDFSIFQSSTFRSLRTFGDNPVVPETIGRASPFLPF